MMNCASGVTKGSMRGCVSRESRIGRNTFRKRRPFDAFSGIVSIAPSWILAVVDFMVDAWNSIKKVLAVP